jgi:branched-subunit amino acid aminotransferase/4-amino-4-deoxychorismate lyase
MELAGRMGLEVVEGLLPRSDIENADEMFLTSTTREIVPIVRVNDTAGSRIFAKANPGRDAGACGSPMSVNWTVLIQED